MRDDKKTKKQLIEELAALRRELAQRKKPKKAPAPARDREGNFRALADKANDGILISDSEGRYVYVNRRARQLTGYSLGELLKMNIADLTHPAEIKKVRERHRKRLAGKRVPSQYKTTIVRKDGRDVPIELSASRTAWHGRPAGLAIIRDISEFLKTEKALKQSKSQYHITLDSLTDPLHVIDSKMKIVLFNDAFERWCRSLGLSTEVIGRSPFEVFPFLPSKVRREYRQVFKTGKVLTTEETNTIDGGEFITETRKIPVREDGNVVRVTTIIRDITEQRQAEEELRESEEKFRTFAEQSPNMIFINQGRRIAYVNPKCSEVMGYKREEFYAAGFNFSKLIALEQRDLLEKILRQYKAGKDVPPHEYTLITKNGDRINAIVSSKRIIYEGEQSLLGVATDITERRRIENELESYKDHLEDLVTTRTLELQATNKQLQKEIAERKKILQDLAASEEKFKSQYKAIPVPTYTWQRKGNDFIFIDYNDEAYRFSGGGIDDFLGIRASKLYRDNPRIRRELRQCYLEKTTIERDMLYHMKSLGEDKYLTVKYAYVPPDLVLVHTEDITKRRRDEEEIRKFKTISDRADYGTAISDLKGQLIYVNEAFAKMHGYVVRDLLGKHLTVLHSPEQLESVKRLNERLKREGSYVAIEVWHKRKDGSVFPTLMSASLIRDDQGHPAFLSATIIDITERKQAEEEIKRQKALLDEVFDGIHEGIGIVDQKETILFCNPAFGNIFEISCDRLLGKNLYDLFPPEAREILKKETHKRRKGDFSTYELPLVTPSGKRKHIRVTASPRYGEDGSFKGAFGAVLDITSRKEAEDELKEAKDYLQILFDFAPEVYYLTDSKGRFVDGNRAFEEISGYSKKELLRKNILEVDFLPPEGIDKASALLKQNLQGKFFGPTEFTIVRKDGARVPVEITSFCVEVKGKTLILNIGRDIRGRKKAEQKLRASEKLFRDTFDLATVGITHVSLDGHFQKVNPCFCDIVEYTSDELLKLHFQDITHPENIEMNLELHRQLVAGEIPFFSKDMRYIGKSDLPIWVNISATLVRDDKGKPDYVISAVEDIRERVLAQQELARSEERHKILFEYAPEGYFLTDLDGRLVNTNRAAEELTGLGKDAMKNERWLRFFTGEFHKKAAAMLFECAGRKDVSWQELALTHKDSKQIIVEVSAFSVKIWDQTFVLHIVHDITKRRKDEETLRESEERYRTLFNAAAEGILVADIKTRKLLYCNPALSKMLGYTEEEIKGMKVSDLHPKGALKHVIAEFEAQARGEKSLAPNIPCLRKDGEIIYADINTAQMQIDGRICNVGFFTDVTERKLAAERLVESEETNRALMNSTDDSAILLDIRGNVIALNEAAAQRFGKPMQDIIGVDGVTLVPLELALSRKKMMQEVVRTKKPVRFRDERGNFFFDTTMYPVIDAKGQVTRVATYARDITKEVKAHETLQQSEQRYRELAELLPVTVFELDLKGNLITTNRAGLEAFGYTQEDVDKGLNVSALYAPEHRERIRQNIAKKMRGETFEDHEYTALRKDGTTFPALIFSRPIFQDGKLIGLRGIVVDISDRKRVEENLRKSEQRYRELTELLPQIVFEIDLQGNLLSVNQYWFDATGYAREDLEKGVNISRLIIPEEAPRARQTLGKIIRGEEVEDYEYTAVRKDGSTYSIIVYLSPIVRDGKAVGFRGVALDISDLKLKEEELRKSEEKFRGIAENVADIIFLTDKDGRFTYLSPAIRQILGRDPEQYIGKPFHAIVHRRDIPQALNSFNQMIRTRQPWIQKLDMVRKDRTVVGTELSATVIIHKGQVVGTQGIIRDITERLKSQQALEQSEAELKNIINLAPDAIMTVDLQGVVTSCNTAFLRQFGYSENQILDQSIYQLPTQSVERRSYIREMFTSLISSKVLKAFELQWIDETGKARTTEIHATFLRSGRKKTGVLAILRDVTKRKKTEEDLLASEEKWRTMAQNIPNIITLVDRKGTILFLNHTLSGVSIKKRLGTNIYDYAAPEHKQMIQKCCERVWKTGSPDCYETTIIGPNGKIVWFESRVGAIKTADQVTALAIISTNITARKREEQIQRSLYLISTAVHTARSLGDLYKTIHRALETLLKTKNLSISLYDREKDMICIEYHVDEKDSFEGRIPAAKTLTAHMLRSEKPLLVTHREIRKLKQTGRVKPIGAPVKVWLGVPLRIRGIVIGALVVNDYRDEKAFDERDRELLELISDQIALSIESKKVQESLRESEKLFRTVAEHSPNMIYVNDFGQIIFVNKKCEQVFGYKRKEYYSADFDFLTLMTPESRDLARKHLIRHKKGQEVPPTEYTMVTRRGRQFRALNTTKLITYNGQPAILGILTEV
ncbi:PAS domain S-box protein [Candidatus Zixiibacteriota bacterium]